MKRLNSAFSILFIVLFSAYIAVCSDNKNKEVNLPSADSVPAYLQDISVSVVTDNGEGSGVIARGKFILTAFHVVEDSFKNNMPVKVISPIYDKDRKEIGYKEINADVISYSKTEISGQDIAVLMIQEDIGLKNGAVFYLEDDIPKLATEVWHCGSFLGRDNSNSVIRGAISAIGRTKRLNDDDKREFDQIDLGSYPGASGSGIYTKDGKYIGMMQLRNEYGGNMFLMCPIRRIREWAKDAKMEWLLDDSLPIPDVKKIEYKSEDKKDKEEEKEKSQK